MNKKVTLLLLTLLIYPGSSLFAGGSWSSLARKEQGAPTERVEIVDSEPKLEDTKKVPKNIWYQIIEQGLPPEIETMQELKQAWNFIARFAQINKHCAEMVQDEHIATLLARKISKENADKFWKHFLDFWRIKKIHTYLRIVDTLAKARADINMQNGWNKTVLLWAAEEDHKNLLKLLLEHGADVNSDQKTAEALIYITENGHKDLVELLLQHGADVNVQDVSGFTPLSSAAHKGYKDIVKLLLKHSADTNQMDHHGWTALMYAVQLGNKEIAALLLQHGAKINMQNFKGHTALIIAALSGDNELVALLVQYGADVNIKDDYGKTALDLATTQEIKNLLLDPQKVQRMGAMHVFRLGEREPNSTVSMLPKEMIDKIHRKLKKITKPKQAEQNNSNNNNA